MSSSSRKRSHPETSEDNKAECPFKVVVVDPNDKTAKKGKKRRKQDVEEDEIVKLQNSPFAPSGKFRNNESMDMHYRIEPQDKWLSMTRYNSFVLNQAKYFSEGFINVANDSTVGLKDPSDQAKPNKSPEKEWVARILEIRASDEHHVYARIYWMYSPDEIPAGARDGNNNVVSGRQPYHGQNELIASNHMDVINVVSVTGEAKVKQWFEDNDADIQDGLYWRQGFIESSKRLSSIQSICNCGQPANPDKLLAQCPSADCGIWLHEHCLERQVLMKAYDALGKDKPYHKPALAIRSNGEKEDVEKVDQKTGRPLSPPDNSAEFQQSIDAKVGDPSDDAVKALISMKQPPRAESEATAEGSITATATATATAAKKIKAAKKKGKAEANLRPYEGLFEADLKLAHSPSFAVVRDLRGLDDGDKEWNEPLQCLKCGTPLN